jgi:signal transduction protein with GAF and PtsI domain
MTETEIIEKLIEETKSRLEAVYDFELRERLEWLQSLNGRLPNQGRARRISNLAKWIKNEADIADTCEITDIGMYINRIRNYADEILHTAI